MRFKILPIFVFVFVQTLIFGQDLGRIGKSDLFKLTGGFSANSVFSDKEDFTYYLSGNVNINISGVYNIPFSFSYSNNKFQSNNPFKFNRLSIHPSYKWVTAHIGDVSMSFSPYTLNGHQFTGLGFDITPNRKFKVSMMYGRLLKKEEYNSKDASVKPSFQRMGYGLKTSYKFNRFDLGAIIFMAKDDKNSLKEKIPNEMNIVPNENIVAGVDGNIRITDRIRLQAELAVSSIAQEVQVGKSEKGNQQYKAYNLGLLYQVGKGNIGVRYEYIDPEYRTLGGYFFNNDLENITLNAVQQLFSNKLSISFNAGLQRDDLDGKRNAKLKRIVSSLNMALRASEKINVSMSYSNFQSHTYIKNQFDYINNLSHIETFDMSNIMQTSQNANLNSNFILKKTKHNQQSLTIGLSFQDAVSKVGGKERKKDNSRFYNGNIIYSLKFPHQHMDVSLATNASYNKMEDSNNYIFGPILSVNKRFFNKKLKTRASVGYNRSVNNDVKQGEIVNMRFGSNYTYRKKHNFMLNSLFQIRNYAKSNTNNFNITFGYNYTFDAISSRKIFKR